MILLVATTLGEYDPPRGGRCRQGVFVNICTELKLCVRGRGREKKTVFPANQNNRVSQCQIIIEVSINFKRHERW